MSQLAEGIDVLYVQCIWQCHGWGITSSRNSVILMAYSLQISIMLNLISLLQNCIQN